MIALDMVLMIRWWAVVPARERMRGSAQVVDQATQVMENAQEEAGGTVDLHDVAALLFVFNYEMYEVLQWWPRRNPSLSASSDLAVKNHSDDVTVAGGG